MPPAAPEGLLPAALRGMSQNSLAWATQVPIRAWRDPLGQKNAGVQAAPASTRFGGHRT